jgi:hypothetical protein
MLIMNVLSPLPGVKHPKVCFAQTVNILSELFSQSFGDFPQIKSFVPNPSKRNNHVF